MPIVKCKICPKEFYGKPYHIKIGYAKYCSSKCMRIGSKTGKVVQYVFLKAKHIFVQNLVKRSGEILFLWDLCMPIGKMAKMHIEA